VAGTAASAWDRDVGDVVVDAERRLGNVSTTRQTTNRGDLDRVAVGVDTP